MKISALSETLKQAGGFKPSACFCLTGKFIPALCGQNVFATEFFKTRLRVLVRDSSYVFHLIYVV